MTENQWSHIEESVQTLVENAKGVLSWSWEERFNAALAQFQAKDKDAILDHMRPPFKAVWDSTQINESPPRILKICNSLGGLRPGQLLLTTDPDVDILLFGAWWPWGGGDTISIRIIPNIENLDETVAAEFTAAFKGWFGL